MTRLQLILMEAQNTRRATQNPENIGREQHPLAVFLQTLWVCLTCQEMSGNGRLIGTERNIINPVRRIIQRVLGLVLPASFVAAPGATLRVPCAVPIALGIRPTFGSAISGCAWRGHISFWIFIFLPFGWGVSPCFLKLPSLLGSFLFPPVFHGGNHFREAKTKFFF